jgi:RNA polymerase sigma-70 factor, ECF subfamily
LVAAADRRGRFLQRQTRLELRPPARDARHAARFVLILEARGNTTMSDTPTNPASDEKVMLAFTQGSPEALTELFRRYQQPIHGFFRRRIADPAQAEELTQETLLALLRAARRYEPRALFRTDLYAIALKILQAHRRKAIFRAAFLGRPEAVPDAAKRDSTETDLWVRRAVAQLEVTDREILLLREFEQLSYAEIADLLHLPLNTVRSRLFRARTALRQLLEAPAPHAIAGDISTVGALT